MHVPNAHLLYKKIPGTPFRHMFETVYDVATMYVSFSFLFLIHYLNERALWVSENQYAFIYSTMGEPGNKVVCKKRNEKRKVVRTQCTSFARNFAIFSANH